MWKIHIKWTPINVLNSQNNVIKISKWCKKLAINATNRHLQSAIMHQELSLVCKHLTFTQCCFVSCSTKHCPKWELLFFFYTRLYSQAALYHILFWTAKYTVNYSIVFNCQTTYRSNFPAICLGLLLESSKSLSVKNGNISRWIFMVGKGKK